MKIKKIGHCCLVIEHKGLKIMTDPGAWSLKQNEEFGVDAILITHEHSDHLHIESLKKILINNPNVKIFTNKSVGIILNKENIVFEEMNGVDGETERFYFKDILFEAFDGRHGEIYKEVGQVQNTGFFIDNKLFYPGDSFIYPNRDVEVLAAPVYGPWITVKNAIDYMLKIKPRKVFPVHDGMIVPGRGGRIYSLAPEICKTENIIFSDLKEGEEMQF